MGEEEDLSLKQRKIRLSLSKEGWFRKTRIRLYKAGFRIYDDWLEEWDIKR